MNAYEFVDGTLAIGGTELPLSSRLSLKLAGHNMTDILADVNAALMKLYEPTVVCPATVVIPYGMYRWLFGWPTVNLLLRGRTMRRPVRFTRKRSRI